ncbi:MAG: hypothetical protein Q8P80_01055 [Candidatus Levybacteria bacterium]|nr:hypothetical protein [Candidatus Levybacteria bacterium]
MKKIFSYLLFLICFLLFAGGAKAISPTPSPSESQSDIQEQQLNEMKDRIASRVAQLKLVERKGVIGTVSDVSDTQISINDILGNTRFIDVDEITKFSSPSSKGSFGISDITKGSKIGVLGLYNKQSRRILARFVDVMALPKFVHGAIASIDSENFTLTIVTENEGETTVDVGNITKTLSYTKEVGLAKSGFSKLTESQNVIIIGFTDIKNKKKIIASRILVFPQIPKNPRINFPQKALEPQDTTVPSTGSGKKLIPITK